jgi:hypothetical protein
MILGIQDSDRKGSMLVEHYLPINTASLFLYLCQNMREAHLGVRFVQRNFSPKMKLTDIFQILILKKK